MPTRQPPAYYDIWDSRGATLRQHARQAKAAGLKAFMFYHYWFAHGRTALSKPLEDTILKRRCAPPADPVAQLARPGPHACAAAAAQVWRQAPSPVSP